MIGTAGARLASPSFHAAMALDSIPTRHRPRLAHPYPPQRPTKTLHADRRIEWGAAIRNLTAPLSVSPFRGNAERAMAAPRHLSETIHANRRIEPEAAAGNLMSPLPVSHLRGNADYAVAAPRRLNKTLHAGRRIEPQAAVGNLMSRLPGPPFRGNADYAMAASEARWGIPHE